MTPPDKDELENIELGTNDLGWTDLLGNYPEAIKAINRLIAEARLDEFNIANKYIDLDYIECRGWKCRVLWCGSCFGEEDAEANSNRYKQERAERKATLEQSLKEQV